MIEKNWSEKLIARAISLQLLNRKCVVLVDNCNWTGYECDVLGVTTDLRIIDVEVKISRADLKADAKKDKWWHAQGWDWQKRDYASKTALEFPRKVWKHYYAMPADIWKPELLDSLPSESSGVLLLERNKFGMTVFIKCVRRAKPNKNAEKLKPEQAIDIARLANLRMWEAYNKLDDEKNRNKKLIQKSQEALL